MEIVPGDLSEEIRIALGEARSVACDIETTGLDPRVERIGSVQLFAREVGAIILRPEDGLVPVRLNSFMESEEVTKIFHHASFDLGFLRHHWNVRARNVVCTKVMAKVLRPDVPREEHGLQSLLARYLEIHLDKTLQRSDWTAGALTVDQVAYAVADVAFLHDPAEREWSEVEDRGLSSLVRQVFEFLPIRAELVEMGVPDVFTH